MSRETEDFDMSDKNVTVTEQEAANEVQTAEEKKVLTEQYRCTGYCRCFPGLKCVEDGHPAK